MPKKKIALPESPVKLKVHKGDTVEIIGGKDRGKRGAILAAYPKLNQVTVEGLNMITRHRKERPSRKVNDSGQPEMVPGGRIEKEAPLNASKVMLVCPHCGRPTRVGYAYSEGTEKLSRRKYRVCKHADCAKNMDNK